MFLMVGFGGGAPSAIHNTHLGDIIVGSGGVIQCDFAKPGEGRIVKGSDLSFSRLPMRILSAVTTLRAIHQVESHQLKEAVVKAHEVYPKICEISKRPEPETDRLYQSHIVHPPENRGLNCALNCGDDPTSLVYRTSRSIEYDDTPTIHYGLIASTNRVMQHAAFRDILAAEHNILCFEMAAARIAEELPCLVICSICDYWDSHSNKEWQGYAAMVAAAYTKDLLYWLKPQQLEGERSIPEPTMFPEWAVDRVAKETDRIDRNSAFDKLFPENEAEYNLLMNQHEDERLTGTRTELLRQINDWAFSPQGKCLFWLRGMPGAGKSTESRTVVELFKENRHLAASFFFERQTWPMECHQAFTFIRQLMRRLPELIAVVRKTLHDDPDIAFKSLKEQFHKLLLQSLLSLNQLDQQPPTVVIVIDALDECEGDSNVQTIIQLLPLLKTVKTI